MENLFADPRVVFSKIFTLDDFSERQSKLLSNISQAEAFLKKAKSHADSDEYERFCDTAMNNFDEIDSICIKINNELDKLNDHIKGNFQPKISFSYISKDMMRYEIYWMQNFGTVLWSAGEINSKHLLAIILCQFDLFSSVNIKKYVKGNNIIKPLFKYHPERFLQTRAYFNNAKNALKRGYSKESNSFNSIDPINKLIHEIMTERNTKALKYPLMGREKVNNVRFMIESEISLGERVLSFIVNGKQILDIDPELTFMLSKTDAEDIPLSLIQLPYRSQYIHFGVQENIELEEGWFFDGAYVDLCGVDTQTIRVTITARNKDDQQTFLWHSFPEPTYSQDIGSTDSNIDLATAITEAYAEQLKGIEENIGTEEDAREMAEFSEMSGVRIVDTRKANNEKAKVRSKSFFYQFEKAIGLIVNSLCYLTAYPEDNTPEWPSQTPSSLKNLYENGTDKERKRAESKLSKLGYTKIRFYGRNIKNNTLDSLNHHQKESHWRRGHYKQQPYGPKSTLRKLIWIMPTLINKHLSEETKGHIYEVKQ